MKPDRTPKNSLPSPGGNGEFVRDTTVWTTSIEAEQMEGGQSYHADIFENGVCVCRIALAGSFESEAAAEIALNRRLRRWIVEYELRPEEASQTAVGCK